MNKQLIITNLQTLLTAVEAFPEKTFDLSGYREETECGTMFCVAGVAAILPHFNAQGMYFEKIEEYDDWVVRMRHGAATVTNDDATDELFGPQSWYNLFASYSSGSRDAELGALRYNGTEVAHKELAIRRLKAQIEAVEAV